VSSAEEASASGGGRMFSDTVIYGLSTVLPQLASLILLPIYTHALSPRDYGILDLMQLIVDFTALFVGMQLAEAIFRFYSGETDRQQANEIVSSSLALACALGAIGFVGIALSSGWLAEYFFKDDELTFLLVLMGARCSCSRSSNCQRHSCGHSRRQSCSLRFAWADWRYGLP
jgi:O-antigen/teichoic acid export membrane protein